MLELADEIHYLEREFSEAEEQERQISTRLMWKVAEPSLTKLIQEM